MTVLNSVDRESLNQTFADEESSSWERIEPGKQDVQAAVNAIDDWVEANMASFNAAIPEPARAGLTSKQKAKLLMFVISRRWEVS